MQEFWKSVKIRQSYHEQFDALFWDTVYIPKQHPGDDDDDDGGGDDCVTGRLSSVL